VFPVSDYVETGLEESISIEDMGPSAAELSAKENWAWLKKTRIEPVVIERAIIQGQDRIFGSVSVEDVLAMLKIKMGEEASFLTTEMVSFEEVDADKLQDGKIKGVGRFKGRIRVEMIDAKEVVDFEIVVKDSKSN
jgi:hypothetical protein